MRGIAAERTDERAVVLVRHLSRAVIELQLLERGKRTVPYLGELELPACLHVGFGNPIRLGRRLSEERKRDGDDAHEGERPDEDERRCHGLAAVPGTISP